MPIYDYDGTAQHPIAKVYDYDGTAQHQTGKVYDYGAGALYLIYRAQSDSYTVTATSSQNSKTVASNIITNTENYEKMVIESVSASGGNFGNNWAKLYCNGVCVLDTGGKGSGGEYETAANAWSGTFDISQNGTVYIEVYSYRDENRDDAQDAITATVKFHFE